MLAYLVPALVLAVPLLVVALLRARPEDIPAVVHALARWGAKVALRRFMLDQGVPGGWGRRVVVSRLTQGFRPGGHAANDALGAAAGALGCPLPVKPGLCRYVRTCVLSSCHGGEASRLVEPVLPGALREWARVGTRQDHCELDAV